MNCSWRSVAAAIPAAQWLVMQPRLHAQFPRWLLQCLSHISQHHQSRSWHTYLHLRSSDSSLWLSLWHAETKGRVASLAHNLVKANMGWSDLQDSCDLLCCCCQEALVWSYSPLVSSDSYVQHEVLAISATSLAFSDDGLHILVMCNDRHKWFLKNH